MNETVTRITLGEREIVLVGTAHISRESVDEVQRIIEEERPDRVCVEIDEGRYRSLTEQQRWRDLNISEVLRRRQGFLLLAQLALASFQKRLGSELGVKPGEEMMAAIAAAKELDIPFVLSDRAIQTTLRRAWARTGFWGKNKLLAALLASAFSREKLDAEQIEKLKEKSALQGMLEEVAEFLPAAKEVLIDERDVYLATRIFQTSGAHIVAVLGAGHVPGVVRHLEKLHAGEAGTSLRELDRIPAPGRVARALPWIIPIAIVAAIVAGFFLRGPEVTANNLLKWVVINGSLAALGALAALAHPLTILTSALAAPLTSLVPVIGVGVPAGLLEATLRKPLVRDFESLNDDIATTRGFFRNRFTHILVVFMLSSLGSVLGTFLGGVPIFASLFG